MLHYKHMKKQSGFTVIELIVVIVVLLVAGVLLVLQRHDLEATHLDAQRKTAINAIYYNLEEVVYPTLKGYPATLDAAQLKAMDGELLKDTDGILINESGSQYLYEPSGCENNICKHYTLRANLEREDQFVKQSKH